MKREFFKDLEFGFLGERRLAELYEHRKESWGGLTRVDQQHHDFMNDWGKRLEVKTCSEVHRTRNLFIEVRTQENDGSTRDGWMRSRGAPLWDELWYYSPEEKLFRVYEYEPLRVATIEAYLRRGNLVPVRRKSEKNGESWQSFGVLVPASSVPHDEYVWPLHRCRPWMFESEGEKYPIHWWGWNYSDDKWDKDWPHYQFSREHAIERGCPPEDLDPIPLWGRYKGERRA